MRQTSTDLEDDSNARSNFLIATFARRHVVDLRDSFDAFSTFLSAVTTTPSYGKTQALCKLHYRAFDSGWLSFTDDHEIIVAEAAEKTDTTNANNLRGGCCAYRMMKMHIHIRCSWNSIGNFGHLNNNANWQLP
jgi:hypothetical protein